MPAPFEILQKTPKTNCGRCGYPTCLAFSASVSKGGEDPSKCPDLDLSSLNLTGKTEKEDLSELTLKRDLALIEHLQEKVSLLHFEEMSSRLGAEFDQSQPDVLHFFYLGQEVHLGKKGILINRQEPEDPRDQILLYNYVHSQGGDAPALDWIGLESLPNSISKVKTLSTYCEERIAALFSGKSPDRIIKVCKETLQATHETEAPASLGFVIPVLPRVPQYLLFWEPDDEEGFPAKAKTLFDRKVLNFLDLESLVFSAERLADRLGRIIH